MPSSKSQYRPARGSASKQARGNPGLNLSQLLEELAAELHQHKQYNIDVDTYQSTGVEMTQVHAVEMPQAQDFDTYFDMMDVDPQDQFARDVPVATFYPAEMDLDTPEVKAAIHNNRRRSKAKGNNARHQNNQNNQHHQGKTRVEREGRRAAPQCPRNPKPQSKEQVSFLGSHRVKKPADKPKQQQRRRGKTQSARRN